MAVARDHLCGEGIGLEPEPFARDPFYPGVELCIRADSAGQLPDPVRLECPFDASASAVELERPARELPPERGRLRVNSVRATDADRRAVLLGLCDDRLERAVDAVEDKAAGVLHLE